VYAPLYSPMNKAKRKKLVMLLTLFFGVEIVIAIIGPMLPFQSTIIGFIAAGYAVVMLAIIFKVRDAK
jgi:hypothetical protein